MSRYTVVYRDLRGLAAGKFRSRYKDCIVTRRGGLGSWVLCRDTALGCACDMATRAATPPGARQRHSRL